MSIDERISDALFDYCIAWRDRASAVQDKVETELRATITQHVAEAVKAERKQVYTSILRGLRSENDSPQLRAIIASIKADYARADNEPNKLLSHRCSSLCSPDETFCAITKDGKCDAMDRSCDAVS